MRCYHILLESLIILKHHLSIRSVFTCNSLFDLVNNDPLEVMHNTLSHKPLLPNNSYTNAYLLFLPRQHIIILSHSKINPVTPSFLFSPHFIIIITICFLTFLYLYHYTIVSISHISQYLSRKSSSTPPTFQYPIPPQLLHPCLLPN